MARVQPPSRYILRKAWELGQKMAAKERRLRPDTGGAEQNPSYALFQQFHRHRLEMHPAFVIWDERLQFLAEREARSRSLPLDAPGIWDAFHAAIVQPIHNAFWWGWEQAIGLEALYQQQVRSARRRRQVIEVFALPQTARAIAHDLPDDVEQAQWEAIAERLCSVLDNNEAIWDSADPGNPIQDTVAA